MFMLDSHSTGGPAGEAVSPKGEKKVVLGVGGKIVLSSTETYEVKILNARVEPAVAFKVFPEMRHGIHVPGKDITILVSSDKGLRHFIDIVIPEVGMENLLNLFA